MDLTTPVPGWYKDRVSARNDRGFLLGPGTAVKNLGERRKKRMKKTLMVLSVAVLVSLPLVFGVAFSYAAAPAGVLKIDPPADVFKGGKKKKAAVEFKHETHTSVKCLDCHHKSDQAKLDAGEVPPKCYGGSCHGGAEKVVDGKKMVDTEDAYHKNCKDCHKKEKKGPTKCKECHPGSED
jgi:hypothetical protein